MANPRPPRALCHPERAEYKPGGRKGKGLCEACHLGAKHAIAKRTPEEVAQLQTLAKMQEELETLQMYTRAARAIIRERLPDYARLHYKASEIAAEKGDTRGIEWALTSVKSPQVDGTTESVVDPPKAGSGGGDGGTKVFIGVGVGGLSPTQAPAITVRTEQ